MTSGRTASWFDEACPHGQGKKGECCLCCDCPDPICNASGMSVARCQDGGNGICDCFIDLEAYLAERAVREAEWLASEPRPVRKAS